MAAALVLVRLVVLVAVAGLAAAAGAVMVVQRGMLNPFGRPARAIRDLTDPLIKPIERRILRSGGNPQSAPWWLLGLAIVAGILAVTAAEWLIGLILTLGAAASSGGRGVAAVLVNWVIGLLMLALLIRVIGSWLGAGRYTPWMRPFWLATEWMVAPVRRILPPFGVLDLSPLIVWFVLSLLRGWLVQRL